MPREVCLRVEASGELVVLPSYVSTGVLVVVGSLFVGHVECLAARRS